MQGNLFTQSFHIPGTLAANLSIVWTTPVDCSLIHVSATGSNVNNGILDVGTTASAEAYVKDLDIGDSSVPAEISLSGFVGGQYPHLPKGTTIACALDYDGAAGTAAQNFSLILTFLEG